MCGQEGEVAEVWEVCNGDRYLAVAAFACNGKGSVVFTAVSGWSGDGIRNTHHSWFVRKLVDEGIEGLSVAPVVFWSGLR